MFGALARRIFGTANERYLESLRPIVGEINDLEPSLEKLSDDELRSRTDHFRERIGQSETLDDLLVEAFATVREAAKRTLGQRHFDVQLMGGIILHRGMISEMKTGEGKTLVSTLPIYLNTLSGDGVHLVTVNDYLAKRDSRWMGQIYEFLGLSVGCILHEMTDAQRREAYAADVTYSTNNELGFDYLRDNMKYQIEDMVLRPFNYAIVDEVDSILIDEARTPLIISGPSEDSSDLYRKMDRIIPKLAEDDYEKDEKIRAVTFTENGAEKIETLLADTGLLTEGGLYDIQNVSLVHHVNQALRAHKLFQRDVDYLIKDNAVIIIDEFTGRMMEGRRFSDGLHQALEAKENVEVQVENQTLAAITFQNYFRLYPKLAGMTGTAMTEANEFADIYSLEVVEVPTNVPCVRNDQDDEIYRTAEEKNKSICTLVEECQERKQPVLVGTVSIEKSEHLSTLLKKRKITHNVLNARYHEQEAGIIAQAGGLGAAYQHGREAVGIAVVNHAMNLALGQRANLRQRDAEVIHGHGDDFAVEVSAGKRVESAAVVHGWLFREDERVVGGGVYFGAHPCAQQPQGIAHWPEHLRGAAQRIGVLHTSAGINVRAAVNQCTHIGRDDRLPRMTANTVYALIKGVRDSQQRFQHQRQREFSVAHQVFGVKQRERCQRGGESCTVIERQSLLCPQNQARDCSRVHGGLSGHNLSAVAYLSALIFAVGVISGQDQRHVRELREIPGGSERALLWHDWMHTRVQHIQQCLR